MNVLFVCTGNICRSPTALAVFRRRLADAGLERRHWGDSAGTHDFHTGHPPDLRSQAAGSKRGYDLTPIRARQLAAADFRRFDLLLGMDPGHCRILARRAPANATGRVRPFLSFVPSTDLRGVPDPYDGGPGDFEAVLDLVEAGVDGLIAYLQSQAR